MTDPHIHSSVGKSCLPAGDSESAIRVHFKPVCFERNCKYAIAARQSGLIDERGNPGPPGNARRMST
jgi:hypothetical protein